MAKKAKSATTADPFHAALMESRRLLKVSMRLYDALERAVYKAQKKHGLRPWSLIAWRDYSAIGGIEIEGARERYLKLPGIDPKKIEAEYRAAKARERAGKRAEIEWDKLAGITAQRREYDLAFERQCKAHIRMAQMKPSTPAGAAAMLAYIKDDMEGGEMEWHSIALDTLVDTLKSWGRQ